MQCTIQSITLAQVREAISHAEFWCEYPQYRSAVAARVIEGVRVVTCLDTNGDIYAWTQTADELRDGDVFVFDAEGGKCFGILVEAWPTLVVGECDALHYLSNGYTWGTLDGGRYAAAASVAHMLAQGATHE